MTADEIAARSAAIGDAVAVRLPADLPAYSPGFYIARGDRGFSAETPRVLDRFYLDLRPEGAVPFIREATRRLNAAGLAFVAKVVDDPDGFDRRDSAVLAFERRDRGGRSPPRRSSARRSRRSSTGARPAMTLPLAPGLAFAEDPGGGESFGCAPLPPHRRGRRGGRRARAREPEERLELVRERFAEAGIEPRRPVPRAAGGGVAGTPELLDAAVRA